MIPNRLDAITETDLQNLISNGAMEGKTIEYKLELPGSQDADKKEFLADVCSFANTAGGDLLFGVRAIQGLPTELAGITACDLDKELQRLDSLIADSLEPRIRYAHALVPVAAGKTVLIFRIDRSWTAPHRVVFKGHDKFYGRNATRKYPLDVGELRQAFTLSGSVAERIRAFRADRLIALSNNETPIPFSPGPKIVLHCLPVSGFATSQMLDVVGLQRNGLIPLGSSGYNQRINFDGLVTYSGGEPPFAYVQLYRNGAVEAVDGASLTAWSSDRKFIPGQSYEECLLRALPGYLATMRDVGCGLPIFIGLALTGVRGYCMGVDTWHRREIINQDTLILPEAEITDFGTPAAVALKPLFDMVWNACGYPASLNFDATGNWRPRRA